MIYPRRNPEKMEFSFLNFLDDLALVFHPKYKYYMLLEVPRSTKTKSNQK